VIRRSLTLTSLAALAIASLPQVALAQSTSSNTGLNPAVLIVPAVVFAVLCGLIANSKGRSVALWVVLGFLFGVIALIIVALLKKQPQAPPGGGFAAPPPPPPPPPPA
jgi:hypothetical protein